MKTLLGFLGPMSLLMFAGGAWGDAPCQKCTHDMEVEYTKCMRSGKDKNVCSDEQQAAALACVAICNPKH